VFFGADRHYAIGHLFCMGGAFQAATDLGYLAGFQSPFLPATIFSTVVAGLTAARFSSAKMSLKVLAIVAALLLALPTSYLLWDFINEGRMFSLHPLKYQALQWINGNTPKRRNISRSAVHFSAHSNRKRTKGGFRWLHLYDSVSRRRSANRNRRTHERAQPRIPESQPSAAQRVVRFCRVRANNRMRLPPLSKILTISRACIQILWLLYYKVKNS